MLFAADNSALGSAAASALRFIERLSPYLVNLKFNQRCFAVLVSLSKL